MYDSGGPDYARLHTMSDTDPGRLDNETFLYVAAVCMMAVLASCLLCVVARLFMQAHEWSNINSSSGATRPRGDRSDNNQGRAASSPRGRRPRYLEMQQGEAAKLSAARANMAWAKHRRSPPNHHSKQAGRNHSGKARVARFLSCLLLGCNRPYN